MRRRDFIKVITVLAAGWPHALSAQQKSVIGFLNSRSADAYSNRASQRFIKVCDSSATLMAKTSLLIIVGRSVSTTDYLRLR
jgi:hypothetical protein